MPDCTTLLAQKDQLLQDISGYQDGVRTAWGNMLTDYQNVLLDDVFNGGPIARPFNDQSIQDRITALTNMLTGGTDPVLDAKINGAITAYQNLYSDYEDYTDNDNSLLSAQLTGNPNLSSVMKQIYNQNC